jgi:integrase
MLPVVQPAAAAPSWPRCRRRADPTRRPLGETTLRDVTVDGVAVWSQGNEQALAPSTAKLALIALNQVFRFAVRRGWTGVNPVMQLEPGEKPRWRVEHVRILEGADLATLLAHTEDAYRPLLECLAYTGLRIGEALGLRWCDVDFEAAVLHVRQQLSRHRTPKHLKTEASRRDVVLAPAVTRLLRARWLASSYKDPESSQRSGSPSPPWGRGQGEGASGRAATTATRARHSALPSRRRACTGRVGSRCTRCATPLPPSSDGLSNVLCIIAATLTPLNDP